MEPTALSGPVADVVAAFEHGETLVKKIREKRAQNGAQLPPAALEKCLVMGPRAIREEYETGCETYGDVFNIENDRTALDAFEKIRVNLQSTFFQHLLPAQEDDTIMDFGAVISAATRARGDGVHVLTEMQMQMAKTPQDRASQPNSRSQSSSGSQQFQQSPQMSPPQDNSFTSPVPGFVWNSHNQNGHAEANSRHYDSMGAALTPSVSANSHFQPSHSAGVTSSPTNHSYTSSDATNPTILSEDVDIAKFPAPPTKKAFRDMLPSPKPYTDDAADDPQCHTSSFRRPNSVSSDGKSFYGSSSGTSFLSGASPEMAPHPQSSSPSATSGNKRITTKIPFHESPDVERRKRLNNNRKPKPVASDTQPSTRPGLASSKSTIRKLPLFGGPKVPKDDFTGFCEGAYLMQRDRGGMKLGNQSVAMTGRNNYWTCSSSKCCFEGHAVPKSDGHKKLTFGFDEDILESQGVRYRWSFLAKSHTTISNSKAGYEYQCVFCVGRSVPPYRAKGSKKFIEHVATHQGQTPNQSKMPPFVYVVGRSASPWEQFDVNLPAETARELETMETPAELEALEQRLPEMEAPLESPANSSQPMRMIGEHLSAANGSGLGIHMGMKNAHENPSAYSRDMRADSHSAGSRRRPADVERTMQVISNDDHRSNVNHHAQNGFHNPHNSPTNEEEHLQSDSPIDQNWSHVRDSVPNLHPAPLFARKPVPSSSNSPALQDQPRKPSLDQFHSNPPSSQFDESDEFEISSYDQSVDRYDNENSIHGGRILVHDSFRKPHAARVMESRQASLVEAEAANKMSTPEMWHPGTKIMD